MSLIQLPQYYNIFNQMIPSEGGRAVPLSLDFSTSNSWVINMTQLTSMKVIDIIQTIFIDNSQNSVSLSVNASISNQNIIVPPYSQGYYPILVPNNAVLTFTCIGGLINTPVFLINIPLPASNWTKNGTPFIFNGSGYLEVSDPVLDAAIANNMLSVLNNKTGSGGKSYPDWIGNNTVQVRQATTASGVLITGAPGYYITGITVTIPADHAQAVAGLETLNIVDSSSGNIWSIDWYAPSVAAFIQDIVYTTPPGFYWNNKVANSTLNVTLLNALTTAAALVVINYGLTTVVN